MSAIWHYSIQPDFLLCAMLANLLATCPTSRLVTNCWLVHGNRSVLLAGRSQRFFDLSALPAAYVAGVGFSRTRLV